MALDPQVLRDSFKAISHKADELSATFYDVLFTRYPAVRPLFDETRMDEQRKKLIRSIALVLRNLEAPERLEPYLQGLGRMHVAYGAEPEHYPAVGECLLVALAETAGPAWTDELNAAWGEAYGAISGLMLQGANPG